jgi:hypothetical protein
VSDRSDSFDLARAGLLLLFVFLIIKVYGVAGYSLTTANGLISAQPVTVLIGSISLYAYVFMAFLAITLLWLLIIGLQNRDSAYGRYAPVIFVFMILAILLSPWNYLIDAIAGTVLAFLIGLVIYFALNRGHYSGSNVSAAYREGRGLRRLYAQLADRSAKPRFHTIVLTVILIELMVLFLATLSKPWIPAENVVLSSSIIANPVHPSTSQTTRPVVFIVDESNGQATMLIDEDRYLIKVPESLIKQSTICHLEDQLGGASPLFEFIFGRRYQPHDISCWRLTDQPEERAIRTPPLWVKILEWQF